jgi:pectate lyase
LKLDPIVASHGVPRYFMSGNVMEGFGYDTDNWKAFQNGVEVAKLVRVEQPLFESFVTTQTAREAYTNVLADVGATFPKRDVIDSRLIEEVRTGTTHYQGTNGLAYARPSPNYPGIIDSQTDVKDAAGSPDFPWPEYRTYNVQTDTDHDGIPDEWEKRAGLDPHNPNDANEIRGADGYTNLERYLGWLVGEFPEVGNDRRGLIQSQRN